MSAVRPALLLVLLLALAPAALAERDEARATATPDDVLALARMVLAHPDAQRAAHAEGVIVRIDLTDGPDAWIELGAAPRPVAAQPAGAYVVSLSTDALVSALDTGDPVRALRCMAADRHVAVASPHASERVALNAFSSRIVDGVDCAPRGDGVTLDRYGARLGWQDPDAPRMLGRADAGVSRWSPERIARAADPIAIEFADPWRAPLAARASVDEAAQGVCRDACPRADAIAPGDWRAALAADPRAQEAAG